MDAKLIQAESKSEFLLPEDRCQRFGLDSQAEALVAVHFTPSVEYRSEKAQAIPLDD